MDVGCCLVPLSEDESKFNLQTRQTNPKFLTFDHFSDKMPQEETVTVRYIVFCGKPTLDGFTKNFEYLEQAPAALCKPHFDNVNRPDPDDTGIFITSLIERHHDEILNSHAWRCVTCDKPATELLHSALPLLSPHVILASADFEPVVMDNTAPICISGGACDRNAQKMMHESAKSALIQNSWQTFENSKTCDKCGKKSGVKVCGGCKFIAYCSKDCQAQSWPYHKIQCELAQETIGEGL